MLEGGGGGGGGEDYPYHECVQHENNKVLHTYFFFRIVVHNCVKIFFLSSLSDGCARDKLGFF